MVRRGGRWNGRQILPAAVVKSILTPGDPAAFANPDAPTAQELRRRAVWTNWRGIADLAPGGGTR